MIAKNQSLLSGLFPSRFAIIIARSIFERKWHALMSTWSGAPETQHGKSDRSKIVYFHVRAQFWLPPRCPLWEFNFIFFRIQLISQWWTVHQENPGLHSSMVSLNSEYALASHELCTIELRRNCSKSVRKSSGRFLPGKSTRYGTKLTENIWNPKISFKSGLQALSNELSLTGKHHVFPRNFSDFVICLLRLTVRITPSFWVWNFTIVRLTISLVTRVMVDTSRQFVLDRRYWSWRNVELHYPRFNVRFLTHFAMRSYSLGLPGQNHIENEYQNLINIAIHLFSILVTSTLRVIREP